MSDDPPTNADTGWGGGRPKVRADDQRGRTATAAGSLPNIERRIRDAQRLVAVHGHRLDRATLDTLAAGTAALLAALAAEHAQRRAVEQEDEHW